MADSGPDVWIVVIRQDQIELVNADSGERRWGDEAARLVMVPAEPAA